MSESQRNEHWSNIVGAFIERQRAAGVEGHEIAKVVESLAQLVASNLVALERNRKSNG